MLGGMRAVTGHRLLYSVDHCLSVPVFWMSNKLAVAVLILPSWRVEVLNLKLCLVQMMPTGSAGRSRKLAALKVA